MHGDADNLHLLVGGHEKVLIGDQVSLFDLSGGSPSYQAIATFSASSTGGYFGMSLALSDKYVVVGHPNTRKVHVFEKPSSGWASVDIGTVTRDTPAAASKEVATAVTCTVVTVHASRFTLLSVLFSCRFM